MFWSILGNALLIFSLRIIDVSMGTIRAILVVRNIPKWAALVGFFEVTVWVPRSRQGSYRNRQFLERHRL